MNQFNPFVSRNAQGVCFNRFQGESRKLLTVCSAGCLRSPTAANVLHAEYGFNTRSAGCELEYAIVPVTGRLLMWADEIVTMESWQAQQIEQWLEEMYIHRNVVCLNIPDAFSFMQPELVDLIKQRYNEEVEKRLSEHS